jgi:hypothetical protein
MQTEKNFAVAVGLFIMGSLLVGTILARLIFNVN